MARRRNHKRLHRKQNALGMFQQLSKDTSCLIPDPSDNATLDADLDSTMETDLDSTVDKDLDASDDRLRSPESVMCEPRIVRHGKDLSPEVHPRIQKKKLDLDAPETDAVPGTDSDAISRIDDRAIVQENAQNTCFMLGTMENRHTGRPLKLDDYLLDKTISIDKIPKDDTDPECATLTNICYDNGFNDMSGYRGSSGTNSAGASDIAISMEGTLRPRPKGLPFEDDLHSVSEDPVHSHDHENRSTITHCRFGSDREHPVVDDQIQDESSNWYGNKQIVPSLEQLRILKTYSEPGTSSRSPRTLSMNGRDHLPSSSNDKRSRLQDYCDNSDCSRCFMNGEDFGEASCSRSGSPPAKRSRTALRFDTPPDDLAGIVLPRAPRFDQRKIDSSSPSDEERQFVTSLAQWTSRSSASPIAIELPTVSESESKTLEMEPRTSTHTKLCVDCVHCTSRTPTIRLRVMMTPLNKLSEFRAWFAKTIMDLLRKGWTWIRRISMVSRSSKKQTPQASELAQLISTIRCEHEHSVSILSEKITHLSDELLQVRVRSEAALAVLTMEVSGMREASNHLADNNNVLSDQLKSLQKALDDIHTKPSLPPPPPPPPLPPPPTIPMMPSTPSVNRSIRTPNRKCSTPLQTRPAITVEDLLKVTLKKAPQNAKENVRNAVPGPKGPVVSLDMLRSVKLKSARRRPLDQGSRSPRSSSCLNKNRRPPPNLSFSPIMPGAESSLARILRTVDTNRRGFKRALSSPTHSETELSKDSPRTFNMVRHSKSHTTVIM